MVSIIVILFTISILTFTKTNANLIVSPDCSVEDVCKIICYSVELEDIFFVIQNLSNKTKDDDQSDEEISLELHNLQGNSIDFNVLPPISRKIINLSIKFDQPKQIDDIVSRAFQKLPHLINLNIENVCMDRIGVDAFSGLPTLSHLTLKFHTLLTIERDFLLSISKTLCSFHLSVINESGDSDLNIANILSSIDFPQLESMKIELNLALSIEQENLLLGGLTTIRRLDFSNCNISKIGSGMFSPIENTLVELNLNYNQLTTVNIDVFSGLRTERILLEKNPWHCDCNIIDLIGKYPNQQIICHTPSCIAGMKAIDFSDHYCQGNDDEHTIDICETAIIKSGRKSITMTCVDDATNNCEEVNVQSESVIKTLRTEQNGDVIIEVQNNMAASYMAVWFETISSVDGSNQVYYESSNNIECISSENIAQFRMQNLVPNKAYTICLVDKIESTVSPFDCLPYYLRSDDNVDDDMERIDQVDAWLMHEDRPLVIGVVSGSAILSGLVGLIVAIVMIRRNPIWLSGRSRRVVAVAGTKNVVVMPAEWRKESFADGPQIGQRKASDISTISGSNFILTQPKRTAPPMDRHQSEIESENKYYLDFGAKPPAAAAPPLPPPNTLEYFDVTQKAADSNDYYFDVGAKK